MTKWISLEGIISAGKSTTLSELCKELDKKGYTYGIVDEPVKKWMDNGLLSTFYGDISRYGYLFQTKAFHDRVMACREGYEKFNGKVDFVILERTIYTDYIFTEQLYKSKQMTQLEWDCYNDWWRLWKEFLPFEVELVVYLKPTLQEAMKRLRERGRKGEEGITEEYQKNLYIAHDERFLSNECPFPVLVWDSCNNIFEESTREKLLCDILNKIN